MSHDIRTPLNGIIGMIEIATATGRTERWWMQTMCEEKVVAKHLLELINDDWNLTSWMKKTFSLRKSRFASKSSGRKLSRSWNPGQQIRGVLLKYEEQTEGTAVGCVLGSLCMSDRSLSIFFWGNAIKYTDAGGYVLCQVTIKAIRENLISCQTVISDNGIAA